MSKDSKINTESKSTANSKSTDKTADKGNTKSSKVAGNKSKKDTLNEKGMKAAVAYLKNKGYDVLDTDYECKFGKASVVSKIDDVLVFTSLDVLGPAADGFPSDDPILNSRSQLECVMASYLREHDYVDMSVRWDAMKILTLSSDKALVRYHINALGVSGSHYDNQDKARTKSRLSDRAKSASAASKSDKSQNKTKTTQHKKNVNPEK